MFEKCERTKNDGYTISSGSGELKTQMSCILLSCLVDDIFQGFNQLKIKREMTTDTFSSGNSFSMACLANKFDWSRTFVNPALHMQCTCICNHRTLCPEIAALLYAQKKSL